MDQYHSCAKTSFNERLWYMHMWAGGMSCRSIARRAWRSPTTVRMWVRRLLCEAMKILAVIIVLLCISAKQCQGMVINMRSRDSLFLHGNPVGNMYLRAGEFVRHTLARCDLLLAAHRFSPILLFRDIYFKEMRATTITEMNSIGDSTRQHSARLDFQEVWKESKANCRAIVVDNITSNTTLTNEFLSRLRVWMQPETRLVILGNIQDLDTLLNYSALRNNRHVIFVALHVMEPDVFGKDGSNDVKMYRRCLYCKRGYAGVQRLQHWDKDSNVPIGKVFFPENNGGFSGHKFKVVAMEYFPYTSYERIKDFPATVRLTDSLDARITTVLAQHLNFTYEVMEPEDCQWGLEGKEGNWTGIIGTLQHENADFSMGITLTTQRAAVVDFCRIYIEENMVILSSKPRPPPEYLSLIKPYEGIVWLMVIVSVTTWGVMLWLLMRIRNRVSKEPGIDIASSLFYGWGLLLEDQPNEPPANLAGQILVGMWLMACLVLRVFYMSSLISRLVEGGKSPVINSIEEMVARRETDGWRWGTITMSGALNSLYTTSSNPDFHTAKHYMQTMTPEEGMEKVLAGDFSYIHNYYVMRILMATRKQGAATIPLHISNIKYPLFPGNTWAFRPGSPFISRFNKAIQQLLDAGMIDYWMEEIIFTYVSKKRIQEMESSGEINFSEATRQLQVVLGLLHLQVTFYLLIAGHTVAVFAFLAERILARH